MLQIFFKGWSEVLPILYSTFLGLALIFFKVQSFSSMVEGKTRKCQHQSFLEVDPCDDSTDEDIRTTIQNATGPKSALFVPENFDKLNAYMDRNKIFEAVGCV
ncbi:dynamin-related protein 3A-like isoform X5 [Magnolia sinica]|uniref:dynamin-related protein 3A-like isoform X5 n=1 Tax=Magnolia sinica TaxID=86752 RepID=UPI0026581D6D|nr:dynamin-related protein 3A-like isoform X5 [Magnolia sinica]